MTENSQNFPAGDSPRITLLGIRETTLAEKLLDFSTNSDFEVVNVLLEYTFLNSRGSKSVLDPI